MSVILLENVSYTYRGAAAPAVNNVSCEFDTGQMYAIIGPSGSGKSTLLSMLAGLDLPTEGDVWFGEERLREMDLDRYRREDISMIFQAFHLFPLMTVLENVCYPMELCGMHPKEAKERARPLLESVGIQQEKHGRFPANLSGGEQQRVAIARSLASGAKTLLADEPTGNLDAANTVNVIRILGQLAHEQGYCVIVVTHDP
ncbi:MAG: ABC transporter ATP-binding protein, partial [Oscillospiraceae bacterium]|nr:ABC transporter ATP-binding protein [Oscillospiraceae bacterium]